jgi:hypothetical protein
MKKFSFKALGATLLTAGLVLAGISGAASVAQAATTVSPVGSLPTFTAGETTSAFSISIDVSHSMTNPIAIEVRGSGSTTGSWVPFTSGNCSSTPTTTLTNCKISSITATSGTFTGTPTVDSATGTIVLRQLAGASAITVAFESAAFTVGSNAGTYEIGVTERTGPPVVGYLPVVVSAAAVASLTPSSLTISGTVGTPITPTTAFSASNFVGAVTYTATNLPPGLSINSSTGVISGTPTAVTGQGAPAVQIRGTGATSGLVNIVPTVTIAASNGGGSSASANLTLNASTGQLVAGSTVAVVASGLQPTAPYSVVVQSTPQTIGSGNATAGAVNTSVTLPAGLEAGWHTLTFTSTAANGSAVSSVTYFKVSASGTLLATSSTIPTELANTGFDALPYLATGAMLTLAGATILLFARRRFSN